MIDLLCVQVEHNVIFISDDILEYNKFMSI